MRTTLVISTPVFNRAKQLAKAKGVRLSTLATEAMEDFLRNHEMRQVHKGQRIRLEPFSMGKACVDIDNRAELFRHMEGR